MNKMLNKKSFAVMALPVLLIVSCMHLSVYTVEAAPDTDTEKVLEFLKDVVQIDTAEYDARLSTVATNQWPWLGGIAQTTGQYVLDSTGLGGTSILTVTFTLWDNELISCSMYEISQGPALYTQKSASDLTSVTSSFLQRYQTYADNDVQVTQMRNILDTVNVQSNTTKTVDNLEIAVIVEDNKAFLSWSNTVNGAGYSRLRLEFNDGQFSEFSDDRKFYTLGNNEINITEDEAISIALDLVGNYSYRYNEEEITNFDVVKEQIRSQPSVLNKTQPLEVYPCWIVDLPLRNIYPGSVSYIEVMIWSDTGEVISIDELGYGFPSETPYPTTAPENTRTNNNGDITSNIIIATAIIAIAISIAVASIAIKKRKK